MQTLERVRTRLRWRSSLDRLLSVQVSLIDILPALKASAVIDKRIWSIGNMDVIFGTVACDEDPIPVGWIEHIHVRTCIRASDQPLPSPPNNGPGEWIPPMPGAP
jgi:hypothetical protein